MIESVPMTREGYNRIKAEISRLENEEMPRVTEKIAEARAEGGEPGQADRARREVVLLVEDRDEQRLLGPGVRHRGETRHR